MAATATGRGRMPSVLVLGAGMSGICMGAQLRRAGHRDFTILEKAEGIGGTWWDNVYPGAQCDVPSHLYQFSFDGSAAWSRRYATQPEIQRYLAELAARHGLLPHLRLGTAVAAARFDGGAGRWTVRTRDGEELRADVLVCSAGPLSQPRYPEIPGLKSFRGQLLHTARWDRAFDAVGKRVAVIGSAASAVQLVPQLAGTASRLFVFQRSPSWILPHLDRPYAAWERALLRLPPWRRAYRLLLYLLQESGRLGFRQGSLAAQLARRVAEWHLRRQVPDEALRARLRPDYPAGCKRVLLSSAYYPALQRPGVELVTEPIARITPEGVVTGDGAERAVDAVVCATGFDAQRLLSGLDVEGPAGVTLRSAWANATRAYHGMTIPGLPNFFLLLGPNTATGHTSALLFIEAQVRYVLRCLDLLRRRRARWLDVRPEALERYDRAMQERLRGTVWAGRCDSWYKAPDGRVVAIYPGTSFQYARETRRPVVDDYAFDRA